MVLIEVAEEIFRDHLLNTDPDQNKAEGDLRDKCKDGKTSSTDKVVPFGQFHGPQKQKPNKDFSLSFVFPGEIYELKKDIKNIFDEEFSRACQTSTSFKQCFENCNIGALFKNEKKLGALISKSKL